VPKIFSIDTDDFIIVVDLKLKIECILFWNKFTLVWDKENPFFSNQIFIMIQKF